MPIQIELDGERYAPSVAPPHGREAWATTVPMTVDVLNRSLYELGCHQTDIGDAFYAADPEWVERSQQK